MKQSCREIICQILTEAGKDNRALTTQKFLALLNQTPGFWEQAKEEGFEIELPDSGLPNKEVIS